MADHRDGRGRADAPGGTPGASGGSSGGASGGASGARSGFPDRWKTADGRPTSFVLAVLGIGVLTLAILLAIIYFSASQRERTSPPICTDISRRAAEAAVLSGEVERLTVVYDEEPREPASDRYGPVLAKLDYTGGGCSNLPQGITNQETVYAISGVIAFYNQTTEDQQVDITYQTSGQLQDWLFATPTPVPTDTPTPTPSPTPSPTSASIDTDTDTGPVPPPAVGATPVAVPAGSPAAVLPAPPAAVPGGTPAGSPSVP